MQPAPAGTALAAGFQAFFEASPSVMLLVEPVSGAIVDANPAAAAFYGYPLDRLRNLNISQINTLPPERIREERSRALAERRNCFLFPHNLASGEQRTVEVYSTPIRAGEASLLLSIIHDVTDRVRSEKALFASEAKFSKTFHVSPMPLAVSEIDSGCILDVNEAFIAQFGLNPEELFGRTSVELGLLQAADREAIRQRVREHGFCQEHPAQVVNGRGEIRTCLVSAETLTIADRTRLLTTWQDITERRSAEREIQRLARLLKESQEVAQVGGWEIDLETDSLYWTEETYRIHELDPGSFAPDLASALAFYAPESLPRIQEAVRAAIQDGHGFDLELELITARGRRIPVQATGHAVQKGGRAVRVVGVFRDISRQKRETAERDRLIAQLSQAQKMDSLGSLAGGIAHDMNNVLGAILGLASANLAGLPADSPAAQAFATIRDAAVRGGKVVKGLLSFARKTPAEERDLDLNAVVREDLELLAHTTLARIVLVQELAAELAPVRGDGNALVHAIMNLCVNAVDAMDAMEEEGTLTIRTGNGADGWVEVRVEDTGPGMPPEVLERAVEPFFTTKEIGKGTGLGLSSVYSTVLAHKGTLAIDSRPGQGTRVCLRFPPGPARAPVAVVEPSMPAAPRSLRVLLVDDDEIVLGTTRMLLDLIGHTVTTAVSGEEALGELGAGLEPDVVILDLNMPGLGGARTLERIRALHPALPVLLATGRADQTALDVVQAHGRVSLLPKPFSLEDIQFALGGIDRP